MKRTFLRVAFAIIALQAAASACGQPCRVDTLLNYLYDRGESDHVMIFAHRGNWRNSAENSIRAFQECIDEGLDGIEVDLQRSKDSVLVILHDETLDRTTTGHGRVCDYTLAELKSLRLRSPIGVVTRMRIPTFEEVLLLAKGHILIQVDKWKPYAEQVVALARKHGCERQIIVRTTDRSDRNRQKYGELFEGIVFMPVLVCKGEGDDEKLDDFMKNYASPAISLSFTREDYPVLARIPEIRKAGFRLWLNSLWDTFNAGHDDELALTDFENSYGWLLEKGGADIIFSDNPMLLKKYLESIGRR